MMLKKCRHCGQPITQVDFDDYTGRKFWVHVRVLGNGELDHVGIECPRTCAAPPLPGLVDKMRVRA